MVKAKSVFAICFISVVFLALLLLVFYPRFSTVCEGTAYSAIKIHTANSDNPEWAFKELLEGEPFRSADCKFIRVRPELGNLTPENLTPGWQTIEIYKKHGFAIWNVEVNCKKTLLEFSIAQKGNGLYEYSTLMGPCHKDNFFVYDDNNSKKNLMLYLLDLLDSDSNKKNLLARCYFQEELEKYGMNLYQAPNFGGDSDDCFLKFVGGVGLVNLTEGLDLCKRIDDNCEKEFCYTDLARTLARVNRPLGQIKQVCSLWTDSGKCYVEPDHICRNLSRD